MVWLELSIIFHNLICPVVRLCVTVHVCVQSIANTSILTVQQRKDITIWGRGGTPLGGGALLVHEWPLLASRAKERSV